MRAETALPMASARSVKTTAQKKRRRTSTITTVGGGLLKHRPLNHVAETAKLNQSLQESHQLRKMCLNSAPRPLYGRSCKLEHRTDLAIPRRIGPILAVLVSDTSGAVSAPPDAWHARIK